VNLHLKSQLRSWSWNRIQRENNVLLKKRNIKIAPQRKHLWAFVSFLYSLKTNWTFPLFFGQILTSLFCIMIFSFYLYNKKNAAMLKPLQQIDAYIHINISQVFHLWRFHHAGLWEQNWVRFVSVCAHAEWERWARVRTQGYTNAQYIKQIKRQTNK